MPANRTSRKSQTPAVIARVAQERAEVRHALDVFGHALRGLYRTQIPRMAAALAYRTIFGFVPTCAILLVVFGAIVSDQDIEDGLSSILEYTQLNELVVDVETSEPPTAFAGNPLAISTPEDFPPEMSDSAQRLEAWIAELVQRIRDVPKRTIGFISALILVYAAIGMLVEIERAFNHVYRCVTGRSWWTRITLYWTILTLGTILLGATFIVGNRFHAWVVDVDPEGFLGWIRVNILGFAATVAISATLLTIAYTRIPNTRVHLRPALVGAIVAAILWEASKWAFTHYITFSANYAQLYGSLALIPIFLLWIYVTWLVVLFGLQVSYALQHFSFTSPLKGRTDSGPLIAEPAMILAVASAMVKDFASGNPTTISRVAEQTDLPEPLAAMLVDAMHQGGMLHEIAGDHEEPQFSLARAPDSILCAELYDRALGLAPYRAEALAPLREAERTALGSRTLAEFAANRTPDTPGS